MFALAILAFGFACMVPILVQMYAEHPSVILMACVMFCGALVGFFCVLFWMAYKDYKRRH